MSKLKNIKLIIDNLNQKAINYMLMNFFARFFVALTQLYAISIFTKIHDNSTTSIIILLFGYIIWFQLFEFGLSQTIQNKFNLRKLFIKNISLIIISHYIFVIALAVVIFKLNIFSFLLLSNSEISFSNENKNIFDIGCSLLIVTSNNLLIHRFLILFKKPYLTNFLLIFQSGMICILLFFYEKDFDADQFNSIIIYFLPQLLINFPILLILFLKTLNSKNISNVPTDIFYILKYSSSFLLITFLSSFLLGLDYLVLTYFSTSKELLSYHVTIRFFYFSFMMYFAYLTFSAKKISKFASTFNSLEINKIRKNTVFIGITSVFLIYCIVFFLNQIGFLKIITNGIIIDNEILFGALIYFSIRVFADTRLLIAHNLSFRLNLVKLYTVQIIVSLIFMPLLCYYLGGVGILISLSLSYYFGFFIKLEAK